MQFIRNLSVFRRLFTAISEHLQALLCTLDPVKVGVEYGMNRDTYKLAFRRTLSERKLPQKSETPTFNAAHLLPLCVISIIIGDSVLAWVGNDIHYSTGPEMANMFVHRNFPAAYGKLSDLIILIGCLLGFTINVCQLFDNGLQVKYRLFLFFNDKSGKPEIFQNGKALEVEKTQAITRAHRHVKMLFPGTFLCLNVFTDAFVFFNLVQAWTGSPYDYLLLLMVLLFEFYALISDVFLMFYFCLTTAVYLRIKQKCTLQQFTNLSHLMQGKWRQIARGNSRQLWRQFGLLNGKVTWLDGEIEGSNRFWGKYLTLYFAGYIIWTCHFVYAALFISSNLALVQPMIALFAVQFVGILLCITLQGSRVVNGNVRLHRVRLQLGLRFGRISRSLQTIGQQLKMERMAANSQDVDQIAFRLLDTYSLNSKLFQMLFTYTSILFMMLFKEQQSGMAF